MDLEREKLLDLCRTDPEAIVSIVLEQNLLIKRLEARIAELESRLNKNSGNSNMPPSSDMFVKSRSKSLRKKGEKSVGGQKGHPGTTLLQVSPDEVVVHDVLVCSGCGASLESAPILDVEKRQIHDIPPLKMVVTEHQALQRHCLVCNRVNQSLFPSDILHPVQYGDRLLSLMVYLNVYQYVPYDRIAELFSDLFGHSLSNGTIAKAIRSCYNQLGEVENSIKRLLAEAKILHTDETGFRVNGERQWIHVVSNDRLTFYAHHLTRGCEATLAQGVLPLFKGVLVHDFFKAYFKYKCGHALCNAHLLRELKGISEDYGQKWSEKMGLLLHSIKDTVDLAKAQSRSLSEETKNNFQSKYHEIIESGLRENLQEPERVGTRGPKKQSKAKNLLNRCLAYMNEILLFMHDLTVPFENNQAERDIRMVKVQQKISGTFRSEEGAKWFCRIRGYISTIKKNNQPVLTSITNAIQGHPYTPT